jgi:hypothetical protein
MDLPSIGVHGTQDLIGSLVLNPGPGAQDDDAATTPIRSPSYPARCRP